MNSTITIMGSVGEKNIYSEKDIESALNTESTDLEHGETFTGRPGTQIYINKNSVVKIRTELKFNARSSKIWVEKILEKEQSYKIHHPHKTWFIISENEGETPLIGNICPRFTPLHTLLVQKEVSTEEIEKFLNYLNKLFNLYCQIAQDFRLRLDEGLSNFGVTNEGEVYYLDDDLYAWDRFISCAHMLGVYFRSLLWLRGEYAARFGQIMRAVIQTHFSDAQFATVLAEQLRNVFMPAKDQNEALHAFVSMLTQHQRLRVSKSLDSANRIALLSDVHSNLPALEKVLDFLKNEKIDGGLVLGDIVGYGPHPSECIERIQDTGFTVIKGNHDHGLGTENFKKGFSNTAKWALEWSMDRVTSAQKKWLNDLPPVLHSEHWLAVHGAPIDPTFFNAYVYHMTFEDNLNFMRDKKISICFHGHTHIPGIYARENQIRDEYFFKPEVQTATFSQMLVCPGSTGQTRNREVGAQFAIFDREQQIVQFHLLNYDVDKTVNDMKNYGFPAPLIRMLQGLY